MNETPATISINSTSATALHETTPTPHVVWTQSMDGTLPKVLLYDDHYQTEEMDGPAASGSGGVIIFQHGPVKEAGVNGTTMEIVLSAVIARLRGFNEGLFRCRENSLAITHLEEALHWLDARTKTRVEQGVEGRNINHTS